MKRIHSLIFVAPLMIALPAGITACAGTQTVGQATDDLVIKSRVGRRLVADPQVERFDVDVDVLDGVVTLRGDVEDQSAADEAVRIAKNTQGVKRVVNKLRIETGEQKLADGDLGIRAAVGTRLLADPDVRRVNIDVDVVDGIVYLSGVVHDPEAKREAERIASRVDGVVRVENELTVSPEDEPLSTDSVVPAEEQDQQDQDQPGAQAQAGQKSPSGN